MDLDPLGYYARLGVAPDAAPGEVKRAFLRQARLLHPDVPGTGDAAAFVRLKEAYDVVSSPLRRAAYRRTALAGSAQPPPVQPKPPLAEGTSQGPWLAALGAVLIATVIAAMLLFQVGEPASPPTPSAGVPAEPARTAPIRPAAPPPALAGMPDHYILPGAGPAVVWRGDPAGGSLTPAGALAAFAPVHVPALPAPAGLVPVALADGGVGYVDAARLMPGDALAARRAACANSAGRPPDNGEVLAHSGTGEARVTLANASISPAVVALRDGAGHGVALVYLAPRGAAQLVGLPPGPWTAEVAFGELWSRACTAFVAGERVLRSPAPLPQGGTLTIGPHAPGG